LQVADFLFPFFGDYWLAFEDIGQVGNGFHDFGVLISYKTMG
jgi:hypothetical protein